MIAAPHEIWDQKASECHDSFLVIPLSPNGDLPVANRC
jgi:hypothetical protein